MALCRAAKGFERIDDPSDVRVLRCIYEAGHGGRTHKDQSGTYWIG